MTPHLQKELIRWKSFRRHRFPNDMNLQETWDDASLFTTANIFVSIQHCSHQSGALIENDELLKGKTCLLPDLGTPPMNISGDWRSYSNKVPSWSWVQCWHIWGKCIKRAFTEEIMLVFLLMLSVFGQSTTVSLDVPEKGAGCLNGPWFVRAHLCTSDRIWSGPGLPSGGFS